MFRTIFGKMIVVFVCIILISFSVSGVVLFYFLDNYGSKEKVKLLEKSADQISNYFNNYLENQNDPYALLTFDAILNQYSENTNSIIWIINDKGFIVFSKPAVNELPESVRNKLKQVVRYHALPDERQYKSALEGKAEYIKETGDFYKLFDGTGWSWLTIEKPLRFTSSFGEERVIGAVYINTPINEVNRTRIYIFRFFMVSAGVAIVIAFLLVYIFSRRISKPLKEINDAARVIAGGEFNKRLSIYSKDEIGDLASSFNQMAIALQNLEDMRRGFIANVSHELRTPMTSIRGFVEGILDETIPQEKQKDYLVIVRDEANRLNRLVNDLLDLAKMEAGEVSLNYRCFDINELIRRCIIKLENIILEKEIDIEASFEAEEMQVYADIDSIERVVINLIHNALKFTQNRGKLSISTSSFKGKAYISIADNGIGIEETEIKFIWDRFYKSDKSRSRDKLGAGLGLAIVKSIVNEHNHEIWVESEVGKGTKFTFTLSTKKPEELNDSE